MLHDYFRVGKLSENSSESDVTDCMLEENICIWKIISDIYTY